MSAGTPFGILFMTTNAGSVTNALSPGARQFIKFCIVGGSSFVIDFGTFNVLLLLHVPAALALMAGFLLGVTNAYTWNSRWTFRDRQGDRRKQIPLFFATNLVGFLLNLGVTTGVLVAGAHYGWTRTHFTPAQTMVMVLTRSISKANGFSLLALDVAMICATVVVTFWNFGASKFITFRAPTGERSASQVTTTT